jgi:hypothetical protein
LVTLLERGSVGTRDSFDPGGDVLGETVDELSHVGPDVVLRKPDEGGEVHTEA